MCDGGSPEDGCIAASRDDTTINALDVVIKILFNRMTMILLLIIYYFFSYMIPVMIPVKHYKHLLNVLYQKV